MALTPTQRQSASQPMGFGPASFLFDPFDAALGTLTGVTVEWTVNVTGDVSAENLSAESVAAKASFLSAHSLYVPTSYLLETTATATGSATLAAFDGSADFAGPSGTVLAGLTGSSTRTLSLKAGDFAAGAFTAPGGVALGAYATTVLNADAGGAVRLLSDLVSVVDDIALTYEYTPPGGGTTGSVVSTNTGSTTVTLTANAAVPSVTTSRQSRSLDAQTLGWTRPVSVAGFDPALGALLSVNLKLATGFDGAAKIENQGERFGDFTLTHGVATSVAVGGVAASLATAEATAFAHGIALSGRDGVDDFAGAAGFTIGWGSNGSSSVRLTDTATFAAFTGSGPVDLSVHAGGIGRFYGLPEVLADLSGTASARLEVSYSYAPGGAIAPIAVANGSKGTQETPAAGRYAGPVTGVVNEFARITTDNLAVSVMTDSWYIRTGDGTDAIQAANGTNVLDGGGGSNFLVGGEGRDTFFVDAVWTTAPLWSTISGLSAGDAATVWGITGSHAISWRDNLGADGAKGLTLMTRAPGQPQVATTLVGYSTADLTNGRLTWSLSATGDLPFLHIVAF